MAINILIDVLKWEKTSGLWVNFNQSGTVALGMTEAIPEQKAELTMALFSLKSILQLDSLIDFNEFNEVLIIKT